MEIDETQLNNYIRLYSEFLPKNVYGKFCKYCKSIEEFNQGEISGDKNVLVDKKIRNVFIHFLRNTPDEKSWTKIHWTNLLIKLLNDKIKAYFSNFQESVGGCEINDIEILKYEVGGHYRLHSDHARKFPRTLSFIYLVNNDYEGGDLVFTTPVGNKQIKIPKQENSLIMWPSNFLYPHMVTPVTKGVRYSIVAWAL